MKREMFVGPFDPDDLPAWPCPECGKGAFRRSASKTSLVLRETEASKQLHGREEWEPHWISERFSLYMECVWCKDGLYVLGTTSVGECYNEAEGLHLASTLQPSFMEPSVVIIDIPAKCPDSVRAEIVLASGLYWASPAACVGRLRVALEMMFPPGLTKSSLHRRIESSSDPEAIHFLQAIKWIGNLGAHSGDVTHSKALDAFELLEHALREIFGSGSSVLRTLAEDIIATHGHAGGAGT